MNCPSNREGITVPRKAERSRVQDPSNQREGGRETAPLIVILHQREPSGPLGSRSGIRNRFADVNLLPGSGFRHKSDEDGDDDDDDEKDGREADPESDLSE